MSIEFKLDHAPTGFAASYCGPRDRSVEVVFRELVSPLEPGPFLERVDQLQRGLFNRIPGLPRPSTIDHLLVVIQQDLSGVAYVNELHITALVKPTREVSAGEPMYASDIETVDSVELGLDIPPDAAVVVIRSRDWRRSLFFDFGPLQKPPTLRDYPLDVVLAKQELLLLGLVPDELDQPTGLAQMKEGLAELAKLLQQQCEDEAVYQDLLKHHPWMLGGAYDEVVSHAKLDDMRIPDFTARRCYDHAHDVVEIKQPFLSIFRKDGSLAAKFNDAWNQGESYLAFTARNHRYLKEEKGLLFENSQCLLLLGYGLDEGQRRRIREKESLNRAIQVRTYDELLRTCSQLVSLVEISAERSFASLGEDRKGINYVQRAGSV